jgi:hypothetical protein
VVPHLVIVHLLGRKACITRGEAASQPSLSQWPSGLNPSTATVTLIRHPLRALLERILEHLERGRKMQHWVQWLHRLHRGLSSWKERWPLEDIGRKVGREEKK